MLTCQICIKKYAPSQHHLPQPSNDLMHMIEARYNACVQKPTKFTGQMRDVVYVDRSGNIKNLSHLCGPGSRGCFLKQLTLTSISILLTHLDHQMHPIWIIFQGQSIQNFTHKRLLPNYQCSVGYKHSKSEFYITMCNYLN